MKLKFFVILLISILFFCTLSNTLTKTCKAKPNDYDISIKNMSYEVVKIEGSGVLTFVYYKLTITLHNSGSSTSDDITVVIIDDDVTEEYPGTKTRSPNPYTDPPIAIPPGESRNFVFGEKIGWMIQGEGKHVLTVNVHPNNNESTTLCSKKFTISSDGDSGGLPATSTPGFEMMLVVSAIFILFLANKKRKK